jgi:hypothetical protein
MSTYSTNLALELIGTGEQAGVWGTTTNTNLGTLIEQSISGYVTQAVATGTDTTITIPNGSSGVARNMYIELTGTGGASTNLIVPANKKLYFIFNNSTGAVTVKVSGQTGVSVPTGKKMVLVSNGTDIVNGLNYIADFASNSATITHLSATSATITNLTLTSLVISNLSIASANITTLTGSTQTLSGNLTLNGGTANGVLFLNGSKVATSGSALTFTGSVLGVNNSGDSDFKLTTTNTGSGSTDGLLLRINSTGSEAYLWNWEPSSVLIFGANAAEQMRLTSTGLGIGTSSPGQKLEVAGNIFVNTSGNPYAEIKTSGAGNNPSLKLTADTNSWTFQGTFSNANDDLLVLYNATTLLDLTKDGNLGLGVTPSAWNSAWKAIQAGNGAAFQGQNNSVSVVHVSGNAYIDSGGVYRYIGAEAAQRYRGFDGAHEWYTAPSGTAGNAISFTQAMTLDASGNLLVGSTSSGGISGAAFKKGATTSCLIEISGDNGTPATDSLAVGQGADKAAYVYQRANKELIFGTNNTERARITAAGDFVLGIADNTYNSAKMEIHRTSAGDALIISSPSGTGNSNAIAWSNSRGDVVSARIYNVDDGAYGASIVFANRTGAGTTTTERARITTGGDLLVGTTANPQSAKLYVLGSGYNATAIRVAANGNVGTSYLNESGTEVGYVQVNASATTYSTSSDRRLKSNIVPAPSASDDIDAIQIVSHDWKAVPNEHVKYGVIAQDLRAVAPQAVSVGDDGEDIERTWGVDYSKLVPMLVKEIQSLRARVAQLESK